MKLLSVILLLQKKNEKEVSKLKRMNLDIPICNDDKSIKLKENVEKLSLTKKKLECEKEKQFRELIIPNIKNHTIYKLTHAHGVVVCGNNGLLLRYTKVEIFTYHMKTNEDIFHIEIVKCQRKLFLVSFTKDTIYIVDIYKMTPCHIINIYVLYEAFVESVVNDSNVIFVTLSNGLIKKVVKDNWKISDNPINIFNFFPASLNCKYCLLSKDSKLYKSPKTDLVNLGEVYGISNVKVVMRIESNKCICYSHDTIWFLNAMCYIMESLTFESGIKFVDRDNSFAVLSEYNNTIHVYAFRDGRFKEKICERKVKENIESLTIWKMNVYVAVGDCILTFRFDDGKYPE